MFCPKCGKKNKDGAKFCEFCGEEIKSEESIHLPKKRKFDKKNIIIIALILIIIFILCIIGVVLNNKFRPSNVASSYFEAISANDLGKVYDFIDVPESDFTSKEIFEKVSEEDDLDLVNYEVINEEISSDGLSAQVEISYTVTDRQQVV